jgi:hypothetical protein
MKCRIRPSSRLGITGTVREIQAEIWTSLCRYPLAYGFPVFTIIYVVGSNIFRPDTQKPRQMKKKMRGIYSAIYGEVNVSVSEGYVLQYAGGTRAGSCFICHLKKLVRPETFRPYCLFPMLEEHTPSHISTVVYRALVSYDDSQCLLMDVTLQVILSRPVRAGIHEEGKGRGSKPHIVGWNSWPRICDGLWDAVRVKYW